MNISIQKGFTLVELLISTAIIVILSGIIVLNDREFYSIQTHFSAAQDVAVGFRVAQEYALSGELLDVDDEDEDDDEIIRPVAIFFPFKDAIDGELSSYHIYQSLKTLSVVRGLAGEGPFFEFNQSINDFNIDELSGGYISDVCAVSDDERKMGTKGECASGYRDENEKTDEVCTTTAPPTHAASVYFDPYARTPFVVFFKYDDDDDDKVTPLAFHESKEVYICVERPGSDSSFLVHLSQAGIVTVLNKNSYEEE